MYLANTSIEGDQKYTCSRKLQSDQKSFPKGIEKPNLYHCWIVLAELVKTGLNNCKIGLTEGRLNQQIRNALVIWVTVRLSAWSLSFYNLEFCIMAEIWHFPYCTTVFKFVLLSVHGCTSYFCWITDKFSQPFQDCITSVLRVTVAVQAKKCVPIGTWARILLRRSYNNQKSQLLSKESHLAEKNVFTKIDFVVTGGVLLLWTP